MGTETDIERYNERLRDAERDIYIQRDTYRERGMVAVVAAVAVAVLAVVAVVCGVPTTFLGFPTIS